MKICFLAPANNYHTKKWCKWFFENGNDIHVISFIDEKIDNVTVHFVDTGASINDADTQKIKYLFKAKQVKNLVRIINPDIVNVHYATSYGTVAAISGLKGYVLSVWGSDIFEFPRKSLLHNLMLRFSLSRATYIFSTSQAMADEAYKYTKKKIFITPFGVNMELFNPNKRTRKKFDQETFIIGTVKALEEVYGIDIILKSAAIIKNNHPEIPIKIRIAGRGTKYSEYKELSELLGIKEMVTWVGFINQEEAAKEWANMDVAVLPSRQESFGISAVEAQACGTPVIISDIAGLKESTLPGESSIVVKKRNEEAVANAIIHLYNDVSKRKIMSRIARNYVETHFELNYCFSRINNIFLDMSY